MDFFEDHIEYSVFEGNEDVLDDQEKLFGMIDNFVREEGGMSTEGGRQPLPDLHDFQLVALSLAPGAVSARFQLEGEVVDIQVDAPILVHCDGDAQSMYVGDAALITLGHRDDWASFGLNTCQIAAMRDVFVQRLGRQQVLLINGLSGIDLVLMGAAINISRSVVPYQEEPTSPEEAARIRSIQAMLTEYTAQHGADALKDALELGRFNRTTRGKKK